MTHDTTLSLHPEVYDGSLRELDMREVDRQWNQWIPAPIPVRHANRLRRGIVRRVLGNRVRPAISRRGRGGHISGTTAMRMMRYAEIEQQERDRAYAQWMQMLEDEEIAQDIREQAMAGEETHWGTNWERNAA